MLIGRSDGHFPGGRGVSKDKHGLDLASSMPLSNYGLTMGYVLGLSDLKVRLFESHSPLIVAKTSHGVPSIMHQESHREAWTTISIYLIAELGNIVLRPPRTPALKP